jgi:uncharacterized protein
MKRHLLFILVLFSAASAGLAQDNTHVSADELYTRDFMRFLSVSGSWQAYEVAIDQFLEMYKSNSGAPESFWATARQEFIKAGKRELGFLLAPVYKKHFSHDELLELIGFYESGIGKKLAASTPAILEESMQAGAKLGERVGKLVIEKLEKAGYR